MTVFVSVFKFNLKGASSSVVFTLASISCVASGLNATVGYSYSIFLAFTNRLGTVTFIRS